jgi:hypothetical protein
MENHGRIREHSPAGIGDPVDELHSPSLNPLGPQGRSGDIQEQRWRSALLDEPGVGTIVAAQRPPALRSVCPPRRRRAAAAPIPRRQDIGSAAAATASSTAAHDRAGTAASTTREPATTSPDAEGKSAREATRLLKRYLAHHLYRLLQNQEPLMT